jgi:hypothetical protein
MIDDAPIDRESENEVSVADILKDGKVSLS